MELMWRHDDKSEGKDFFIVLNHFNFGHIILEKYFEISILVTVLCFFFFKCKEYSKIKPRNVFFCIQRGMSRLRMYLSILTRLHCRINLQPRGTPLYGWLGVFP